jgi:serine/threonine-protein kinase
VLAVATGIDSGQRIGRYQPIRRLAVGGMAEIFLARLPGVGIEGFEKLVVLKRILPQHALDPELLRMFLDEARLSATLTHPHVIEVYDVGAEGDAPFFAMEYVHGANVREMLRAQGRGAGKSSAPLPLAHAVTIVAAAAEGLHYAHDRLGPGGEPLGIVHRDVSPSNVLCSYDGAVKVSDFGIAKWAFQRTRTQEGTLKGKFAYMSPEQSLARPLDGRSDLFSVGTVLYVLTTGRKPFDGPTDADVIMQVRRARPAKPSTVVRDLNPDIERLINRALRASPGKRWQSAEQMADKIDAILVKLGEPSGPAPLKRWLETLSAKDGAKPPVPVAPAAPDPSIAVDLGSMDLELEEVAQTAVEQDRGTGLDTRPLRAPARPEPGAPNAPTWSDPTWAARLKKAARAGAPAGQAGPGRFKRWVRRMTIRAVLIVAAVGGAFYFAHPHLPAWAKQPIDNWLRGLYAPLESKHRPR